ncbi:MAG: methionine ABC transporter ATP-binding protein, partial [Peptoniphilaceae bacterium]|nr:methionine ABC transporter ATP-binding protein [Peptoniphilaceae bacterium]
VAKDICDRIAVMDKGKIIELQTVNELFSNPKTEITKSFIKNLVHDDEEEIINQNDFEGTVLRITFDKDTFNKPILSEIVKKTNVDINIIQGNINVLNSSKVGYTIAEVVQNNRVDEVIKVLKEFNVNAEVLK